MRKVMLAILSTIGVLVLLLLMVPLFFKGEITNLIKREVEKKMNVELSFSSLTLSMLDNFPNMSIDLTDIVLIQERQTNRDTIAKVKHLFGDINFGSLIKGENYILNHLLVENAVFFIIQDSTIAATTNKKAPQAEDAVKTPSNKKSKGLYLNDITLKEVNITYINRNDNSRLACENIALNLVGELAKANSLIKLNLDIPTINYYQNKGTIIRDLKLTWQADIAADFSAKNYAIKANQLHINGMPLSLTGTIADSTAGYVVDLKAEAPGSDFKTLFSIFPPKMAEKLKPYETKGSFTLSAWAKGLASKTVMPHFFATLRIDNGSMKYPTLEETISNINLNLTASNPGGSVDSTLFNLETLSFQVGKSPFYASIRLTNPNDWYIDGQLDGVLDFGAFKKTIPLDSTTIDGRITMDVVLQGYYRYIEQQQFDLFKATGKLAFDHMLFKNKAFPEGISIASGTMVVSPERLQLKQLKTKLYSSDVTLEGYLSNYIPYFIKHEQLKGNFKLASPFINLNEIIIQSMRSNQAAQKDISSTSTKLTTTSGEQVLIIPNNIDLQVTTQINRLLFDKMEVTDLKGAIVLTESRALLNNLTMRMLNGTLNVNGAYDSRNSEKPEVKLVTQINNFDINQLYKSFSFIQKSIPFAMNCNGTLSAQFDFKSVLDKQMEIIPQTLNGKGYLASQGFIINHNGALDALSTIFNSDELKRISVEKLKIEFAITNGNIRIEPFTTNFAGNKLTMSGNQSVDGQLDYKLSLDVRRKYFGSEVEKLLRSVPGASKISSLPIEVEIGGTLTKPEIKPNITKAIKQVTNAAFKELKSSSGNDILKSLKKLFQ